MKIITPISHLFNNKEDAIKISSLSDELEARERTCDLRLSKTTHYHIDFDINIGLSEKQIDFLKEKVKPREEINVLTFQATKDFENADIVDGVYKPLGERIGLLEQLKRTSKNIKTIRNIVGGDRIIGIENNNYYPSSAYDIATSKEYIVEAVSSNNLKLLFDYAHAKVSCVNRNEKFEEYSNFLLDNTECIQLHLCEFKIKTLGNKKFAYDAHDIPPIDSTLEAIKLCKKYQINGLTREFYRDPLILSEYLKDLRILIKNF